VTVIIVFIASKIPLLRQVRKASSCTYLAKTSFVYFGRNFSTLITNLHAPPSQPRRTRDEHHYYRHHATTRAIALELYQHTNSAYAHTARPRPTVYRRAIDATTNPIKQLHHLHRHCALH
jgi:hypothetical protein